MATKRTSTRAATQPEAEQFALMWRGAIAYWTGEYVLGSPSVTGVADIYGGESMNVPDRNVQPYAFTKGARMAAAWRTAFQNGMCPDFDQDDMGNLMIGREQTLFGAAGNFAGQVIETVTGYDVDKAQRGDQQSSGWVQDTVEVVGGIYNGVKSLLD